jgi:hypothetical protein
MGTERANNKAKRRLIVKKLGMKMFVKGKAVRKPSE